MIFSELYSAYYNTVARILAAAVDHPLQKQELRALIEQNAFGESILNIEPAISGERWRILHADGSTPLLHPPTMPLTTLEKRWIRAILEDPRIRLFSGEEIPLPDVEPLFRQEDVVVFDKYADGDPYTDPVYISSFRLILDGIRNRYPVSIQTVSRRGSRIRLVLMPEYLEYSEKDDKFRLIGTGHRGSRTVNLARILSCEAYPGPYPGKPGRCCQPKIRTVEFELFDRRNALERVLLHFAHFEKQAEKLESGRYKVTVSYDQDDETEVLIRMLSFGPMVKVTAPQTFVTLMRERLKRQMRCGE